MKNSKNQNEIIIYTAPDGNVKVDSVFRNETIWLTQKNMAGLFDCSSDNISLHLKNIYKDGELSTDLTTEDFSVVQKEGARNVARKTKYYNLDVIIAVGYRVNSKRATQFRIWATNVLKEYIIKGFAMDDKRLKQADQWDYFDEWLERIRDIRASEKRFYQKIRDIYATAVDYDKNSQVTREFYATVQNKMHYAVHGHTAA